MKSILRSPIAAAMMLLAPLGAALVAQPAAAQHRVVVAPVAMAPQPWIERFVLRAHDGLDAGSEARFRLVGAPGGQAWLDIPDVLRAAPMVEVRPGVYQASYVIRRRDDPDAFARAVAVLRHGGSQVAARVEVRGDGDRDWGRRRDEQPPLITDLTPSHRERVGDRGWTRISARVNDDGSGIDPASVVLRVDGRDVSGRVRLDGDELRYREDLQPGRHTAELEVRDRAGNTSRRTWTFAVVDRERPGYGAYGSYGSYGYGQPQRW